MLAMLLSSAVTYSTTWTRVLMTESILCMFFCMYAGKPNLRLPLNTSVSQVVINEVCSPSPVIQSPNCGSSCQSAVTCPESSQSETFHWPDVQELRSKYTGPSRSKVTRSCTVPNGMLERPTNMCNGCSHKYSSFSDLYKALSDTRTQSERVCKERCTSVEDWPQVGSPLQNQPLLCRWSSLDHMLGSLPLSEVQNLQEPMRTSHTANKLQEDDNLVQEGFDCAARSAVLSSGTMSESNLVKSLREKFQGLSTGSWTCELCTILLSGTQLYVAHCLMLLNWFFSQKKAA